MTMTTCVGVCSLTLFCLSMLFSTILAASLCSLWPVSFPAATDDDDPLTAPPATKAASLCSLSMLMCSCFLLRTSSVLSCIGT